MKKILISFLLFCFVFINVSNIFAQNKCLSKEERTEAQNSIYVKKLKKVRKNCRNVNDDANQVKSCVRSRMNRYCSVTRPGRDIDLDGLVSSRDNCPNDFNADQKDDDSDDIGDVCEIVDLVLGDGCSNGVFGFRDVRNSNGFSIQDFFIDNTTGLIDQPRRIIVDRTNDRLIVLNNGNSTITFYNNFSTLSGQSGIAPSFTFDNATSLIDSPEEMILLPNGSLLVSNSNSSAITRFDPPFANNMAPSVVLTTNIDGPSGLCYEASTNRWAVTQSDNFGGSDDEVLIFENATSFTASATPFATLDSDGSFISSPEEGCFFSKNGTFFVYVDSNGVGDRDASAMGFNSATLVDGVKPLGNLGGALYNDIKGMVEVDDRLFIADYCEMEEFSSDDEDGCFPLRAFDYDQSKNGYSQTPDAAFVGHWAMVDEPEDIAAAAGSIFTISDEFDMVIGWNNATQLKGVDKPGQGGGTVEIPDIYAVPDYPGSTNSACNIDSIAASSR